MSSNKFYSSLIINSKLFPAVHQVFKPRYNKEYFKRLTARAEDLNSHVEKRCKGAQVFPQNYDLAQFKNDSKQYVKLNEHIAKLEEKSGEIEDGRTRESRSRLLEIEDKIMPIVVKLPNLVSESVPTEDKVLEQVDPVFNEKLSKVLSHTKLSYINKCYSKSVVGPNSHYYYGIGAKLQQGLSEFFTSEMCKNDFLLVSGLCLTKSAVVEAANASDGKNYVNDPARILSNEPNPTALHVSEVARESLLAFCTTLGHRASNHPMKLVSSGTGYRCGPDWFGSDEKRIFQFETAHAIVVTPSIMQYSMKDYQGLVSLIYGIYGKLNMPVRLVKCSIDSMFANEFDSHRIDVWLPSRHQWVQTGRISHYANHLTVRAGIKRGHIIDSTIYDGQALVAAIIENNQTATGRFTIPSVIKEHMIHLSEEEHQEYFKHTNPDTNANPALQSRHITLTNYEQRRHFVRRTRLFSHSKRAHKNLSYRTGIGRSAFFFIIVLANIVDWKEAYLKSVPKWLQRSLYDNVYRRLRRVWWFLVVYGPRRNWPKDITFDETDQELYDLTLAQRRQKLYKPVVSPTKKQD